MTNPKTRIYVIAVVITLIAVFSIAYYYVLSQPVADLLVDLGTIRLELLEESLCLLMTLEEGSLKSGIAVIAELPTLQFFEPPNQQRGANRSGIFLSSICAKNLRKQTPLIKDHYLNEG